MSPSSATTSPPKAVTGLDELAARVNRIAHEHGFWDGGGGGGFAEKVALVHSELSEALEEDRAGHPLVWHSVDGRPVLTVDEFVERRPFERVNFAATCFDPSDGWVDTPPKPEGAAVELADALIRILDLLAEMGVDVNALVEEKVAYNEQRPYLHGKKY